MAKDSITISDPDPGSIASKKSSCCSCLTFVLILTIFFVISALFFWIAYPYVFNAIFLSTLRLKVGSDGMPSFSTFMWAKPPVRVLMKFYMWNLTNPEEVFYYGAKPSVVEIGPFSVWETEQKREYEFNHDQTRVWYKNYKKYIFDESESCEICTYDAKISMTNLIGYGTMADLADPQYNVSNSIRQLFAFGGMLLGESPFIIKNFGDIVFDGYADNMLSAAHSELVYEVSKALNQTHFNKTTFIPVPVPDMAKMAFFYGYNNTNDEEYVIETGKSDIKQLGRIVSWANQTELPSDWYSTDQCRMINGTDSGSFQAHGIGKNDRLDIFLSFFCRSLYLEFNRETDVKGVSTYEFVTPMSVFDTTIEENRGMRYPNTEKINYAPQWPDCPPKDPNVTCSGDIDCGVYENLCHDCCDGSFVDDTYLLPPGLFPVKCYPGKFKSPPFTVVFSAPHYAYSPPELRETIIGMNPSLPDHIPIKIKYEPNAGVPLEVTIQFQVATPMYRSPEFVYSSHLANVLLPFMWVSSSGTVEGEVFDNIKLGFKTVPIIILAVKIFATVAAVFFGVVALGLLWRRRTQNGKVTPVVPSNGRVIEENGLTTV
uniref:CD36 family protein n=1 Tax=Panagrellus redivivus TaxID=6233 RepID=A0A7E4V869_PANRE